jgi:hypothetical protein
LEGGGKIIETDSSCGLFISARRFRELLKLLLLLLTSPCVMLVVVMSVMMVVMMVMVMWTSRSFLFVGAGPGARVITAAAARHFSEAITARVGRRCCCRRRKVSTSVGRQFFRFVFHNFHMLTFTKTPQRPVLADGRGPAGEALPAAGRKSVNECTNTFLLLKHNVIPVRNSMK